MNAIKVTLSAYSDAHKFIWKEGIIKLIKVPLLLTLAYFPFMFLTAYFLAGYIVSFFQDLLGTFVSEGGGIESFLKIIVFFLFAVLSFITYRSVVLFFYSFSIDKITDRVEISVIGKKVECERTPKELIMRMIVMAFITILGTITLLLFELFANFIPLIGGLLALIFVIPCQIYLTGIGFIDPYLDRVGLSGAESFRVMRKHFFTIMLFSLFGGLILLIPIIGWLLGPTYSIVAGIIIALGIDNESKVVS
ncbi:MAG: EI24 domain-containing protein [Verrucomicrobiota bacterium]|nr:EI24 domain-containing protein [Verrucomicrobiota bacterium]